MKSLFCSKCGGFLRKRYVFVKSIHKRELKRHTPKREKSGTERFFPYKSYRPFQNDAIDFAFNVVTNRKIGLLSSPCGTGKSVSVLTAFFKAKDLDDSVGRLFALTRTRNQLEIYCRELKRIKAHSGADFVASIFQSKREMCPYVRENARLRNINYHGFLNYCRNLKNGAFGKTCRFYERTYNRRKLSYRASNVVNKIKKVGPLLPAEVYEIGVDAGVCPYEVTKALAKCADVLVGNYNYILVDSVRNSIFSRAGIKMENVNCIFDEAHSLPNYAVDILSDELSMISIKRAQREVEAFDINDFGVLNALEDVVVDLGRDVYEESGFDVEHVIETSEIIKPTSEKLGISVEKLLETVHELSDLGEIIQYKRAESGRNPFSYLSRCASFLSNWTQIVGTNYAKYVTTEVGWGKEHYAKIGIRCLDPALAAGVINKIRSAILMSGTLWHTDYYIDVLGIKRSNSESIELPSPYPRKNRLIMVDTSVTTKFERRDEEQWKRIADHLQKIVGEINGRVAVYFPSYAIMHQVIESTSFDLPYIMEERHTKIVDLLQFLDCNEACVVFGVSRGKISEGVDMSKDGRSLLSAVITVGLPYPKRTELQRVLVEYFEERFGAKAIEYAIGIPCLNALAQSAGRLLRDPEDEGIIVMMDRRAAGRFKYKLPRDWREDMEAHYDVEKILERIRKFTVDYTKPAHAEDEISFGKPSKPTFSSQA